MGLRSRELLGQLTPEQRAEFAAMQAESRTPEAQAEEAAEREAAMDEYPPRVDRSVVEFLAAMRLLRERRGLSLADLAERTGMPRSALSQLETGKTNPTVATLGRYARAMGMRLELTMVEDA